MWLIDAPTGIDAQVVKKKQSQEVRCDRGRGILDIAAIRVGNLNSCQNISKMKISQALIFVASIWLNSS